MDWEKESLALKSLRRLGAVLRKCEEAVVKSKSSAGIEPGELKRVSGMLETSKSEVPGWQEHFSGVLMVEPDCSELKSE